MALDASRQDADGWYHSITYETLKGDRGMCTAIDVAVYEGCMPDWDETPYAAMAWVAGALWVDRSIVIDPAPRPCQPRPGPRPSPGFCHFGKTCT